MAAPRVDRRLAAIMAVDVVGYSRLMGQTKPARSRGSRPTGSNWRNP